MTRGPFEGWLFLRPDAVPKSWEERAVDVKMVPLLPGEAQDVLGRRSKAEPDEESLLRLIAEGLSTAAIARRLSISSKSVQRRISRLEDRFSVSSKADLALVLARSGFGPSRDETGGVSTERTPRTEGRRASPGERPRRKAARSYMDI